MFAAVKRTYRGAYLHNLALGVGLDIYVGEGVDCVFKLPCAFQNGLFVVFLLCDVADNAYHARHLAFAVSVEKFCGGRPFHISVLTNFLSFNIELRRFGFENVAVNRLVIFA